jgi:tripartite-type tricarboxylate transporter receptor subunit TctC
MKRRHLAALLALALLPLGAGAAWPEKAVKIIVPYPAGGAADTTARLIGQQLALRLGQPVVVENKAGASGTIGAAAVASAPADGHTLLLDATGHATNASLYAQLPYKTADFIPISLVAVIPNLLVVPPTSPAKSLQDLVKTARDQPGKLTFASAGSGGAQHLAAELFRQAQSLELVHVPYKGGAPALTDVMGGSVDMMFSAVSSSGPLVKAGKLRALATTGKRRTAGFADVPTVAEAANAPRFEVYEWNGLFAPKGTPQPIVNRLEAEMKAIVAQPAVRQRLADLGAEPVGSSAPEFADFLRNETAKWAAVIKGAGIKAD